MCIYVVVVVGIWGGVGLRCGGVMNVGVREIVGWKEVAITMGYNRGVTMLMVGYGRFITIMDCSGSVMVVGGLVVERGRGRW